jgi:hypothetical protein
MKRRGLLRSLLSNLHIICSERRIWKTDWRFCGWVSAPSLRRSTDSHKMDSKKTDVHHLLPPACEQQLSFSSCTYLEICCIYEVAVSVPYLPFSALKRDNIHVSYIRSLCTLKKNVYSAFNHVRVIQHTVPWYLYGGMASWSMLIYAARRHLILKLSLV